MAHKQNSIASEENLRSRQGVICPSLKNWALVIHEMKLDCLDRRLYRRGCFFLALTGVRRYARSLNYCLHESKDEPMEKSRKGGNKDG